MVAFDLHPHKCATCGKEFESRPEWAYKIGYKSNGKRWFCTYHCMQEYRAKERKKKWTKRD